MENEAKRAYDYIEQLLMAFQEQVFHVVVKPDNPGYIELTSTFLCRWLEVNHPYDECVVAIDDWKITFEIFQRGGYYHVKIRGDKDTIFALCKNYKFRFDMSQVVEETLALAEKMKVYLNLAIEVERLTKEGNNG